MQVSLEWVDRYEKRFEGYRLPKGKAEQYVPVFVGSTFVDLKSYRDVVRKALHRLETIVKGMEYFGSKPGSTT